MNCTINTMMFMIVSWTDSRRALIGTGLIIREYMVFVLINLLMKIVD